MGLPYEGLSSHRASVLLGTAAVHHLILGRGMVSDDTEHTCFTASALIESQCELDSFTWLLARSFRWWLLSCPAGVGLATARAIVKLWVGFSPLKSGVFSAGNGPAMRSPLLGVIFADDPKKMKEFVRRSARITHSDPKAYSGALCAALAAAISTRQRSISPSEFLTEVQAIFQDDSDGTIVTLIEQACRSAEANDPVAEFARQIGSKRGVSGYILHTIPCVIQTWLRYQQNYSGGVQEIIQAGGDTDTTAAILGGIIGAGVGKKGIPEEWLNGIIEWPRNLQWMEHLADTLANAAQGQHVRVPKYCVSGVLLRNILFLIIVIGHGLRRLCPPY